MRLPGAQGAALKAEACPPASPGESTAFRFASPSAKPRAGEDAADLAAGVRWFLTAGRDEPPQGYSLVLGPQRVTLGPAQLGKIP